jgi:hypothetical protein
VAAVAAGYQPMLHPSAAHRSAAHLSAAKMDR